MANGTPVYGQLGSQVVHTQPQKLRHRFARVNGSELRVGLAHFAEDSAPRLFAEDDRYFPDTQIKRYFRRATRSGLLGRRSRVCPAQSPQRRRRAQSGMAGKGQLFFGRKNSHSYAELPLHLRPARQYKGGLRKVHLARQGLHLEVAEPAAVRENSERISLERPRGEDI
jgi:hypothetical protein